MYHGLYCYSDHQTVCVTLHTHCASELVTDLNQLVYSFTFECVHACAESDTRQIPDNTIFKNYTSVQNNYWNLRTCLKTVFCHSYCKKHDYLILAAEYFTFAVKV
jgi:hypothetical protein